MLITDYPNKTAPVSDDTVIVSDSENGGAVKHAKLSDLPVPDAVQVALDAKEGSLPAAPTESPESYFLRADDKDWHKIVVGSGGFAANLYASNNVSTVEGTYLQLSYSNDSTGASKTITANNGETLGQVYLFENVIGTTSIDPGNWTLHFHAHVDIAVEDTYLRFEVFAREADGTENTLFSATSDEISALALTEYEFEIYQEAIAVNATDRLGVRVYANTTRIGAVTVTYTIGDGTPSYFNTPLALRHSQLRDLNGDTSYLHVSSAEKADWDAAVSAISLHLVDTDNPHGVTADQISLGNVDNTADADKVVLSASKLTTARNISGVSFDGTQDIDIPEATVSVSGLMSYTDKSRLDELSTINEDNIAYADVANIFNNFQTINYDGASAFILNKSADNQYTGLGFAVAGLLNWLLYTPNTGSGDLNLQSRAYTTDGAFKANVLSISWSTGIVNFSVTPTAAGNTIWHAGNDGSGSGLDAGLLAGKLPSTTAAADKIVASGSDGLVDPSWFSKTTARVIKRQKLSVSASLILDFVNQDYRAVEVANEGLGLPKALTALGTFTRSTVGSYFDTAGVLKSAAIDTVRIDHDPYTGERLGFLSEPERTNYSTYCTDLANVAWNKSEATATSGYSAPDLSTNAVKLVESSTASVAHTISKAYSTSNGTTYTSSVYAKAGERSKLRLFAPGANVYAHFDLSAGTVLSSGSGTVSAKIRPVGRGWYRCVVTGTSDGSSGNYAVYISLLDDSANTTYTGNGTSGLYLWGTQLEAGEYDTSLIQTTSAALTRGSDLYLMSNLSTWYNHEEWTAQVNFDTNYVTPSSIHRIAQFYDSSSGTRLNLNLGTNGGCILFNSIISLNSLNTGYTPTSSRVDRISTFSALDSAGRSCDEGYYGGDRTPFTLPDVIDRFALGSPNATPYALGGHIKSLRYYPRAITVAQLQELAV